MKLLDLRKELKQEFIKNNIEPKDVDFIVSEVLKVKVTELSLIDIINNKTEKDIRKFCKLRLSNKPVQKIFNNTEFFGLNFYVDKNVLCPRPETEILVEKALEIINENNYKKVLDLCTGSGCIAISIKKNANVQMLASDISSKALKVAKKNAENNNVQIKFVKSNMFEKINEKFDLIVSNPPYIDSKVVQKLDLEVKKYDPILALDGGGLGLKFYRIIHDNLREYLNDNGMAILEIGEDQKEMLIDMFKDFKLVKCLKDYSENDRILIIKK